MARIDGYKFGQKNNWRRTVANEVSARVGARRRDALVCYLPGVEDLDRPIYCAHGFSPENLVAIDRDVRVIEALRARGKLAMRGDLASALVSWPNDWPIDVVIADLTCGADDYAVSKLPVAISIAPLASNAVLVVNALRGRDGRIGGGRREIRVRDESGEWSKHRGRFIAWALAASWMKAAGGFDELGHQEALAVLERGLLPCMDPRYYEYRSGTQVFDSVVLSWLDPQVVFSLAHGRPIKMRRPEAVAGVYANHAGRISALRAIRTQRCNGSLPPCPAA